MSPSLRLCLLGFFTTGAFLLSGVDAARAASPWAEASFPTCSTRASTCVGLTVYVAQPTKGGASGPVRSPNPEWFSAQLRHANRLFAPMGVGFEVAQVQTLPSREGVVGTRKDRDRLGARRHRPGTLHVFVVHQLANVDAPGVIRGVHWRLRSDTKRRWVILAGYAAHWVLAHEIGHFFGLPHSSYRASVMNKRPATKRRPRPAPRERVFVAAERAKAKLNLQAQLRRGAVVNRQRRATESRKRRPAAR